MVGSALSAGNICGKLGMSEFAGGDGPALRADERRSFGFLPYLARQRREAVLNWQSPAPPYLDSVPALETVLVATREELAANGAWAKGFCGQYKDSRYYEIVEDTLHPEFRYRYFLLQERTGETRGIQPFFVLDQDILAGANDGVLKSAVESVRRRWPKFLSLRTLMIGCVAGEGHLDNRSLFANPSAARLLARAALDEAKKERAGLVVFKEFPSVYRDMLKHVREDGFIRLPSLPMSSVSIAYKSFDEYMTKALSRATRKDLRRKFKAAQCAALKMSVVEDATPFIDEIYTLYLNVYKRSKLHFEKLTKEYLCELGRRMPDKTRFFLWRQNGRVVAFNLCMVHDNTIYDQYIGLDYAVALDLHLYHYTIRDIMSWAIANGYHWYRSNGLNYDPKLHL